MTSVTSVTSAPGRARHRPLRHRRGRQDLLRARQHTVTPGTTKSDLDPSLPTVATDPALCGALTSAPTGGLATGPGGAAGTNGALTALGGTALLGAAGTGVVAARRRRVAA